MTTILTKTPPERKITAVDLSEGFKSRLEFQRNWSDALADFMTGIFGTISFLILNSAIFAIWLALNAGIFPVAPFDPFPFGLLTTIVSLEAIFLSVIVLISQNRQGRIADIRQQMDFEIDVRAEEEISKILVMLDQIRDHLGLTDPDEELEAMIVKTNLSSLQKQIEGQKIK